MFIFYYLFIKSDYLLDDFKQDLIEILNKPKENCFYDYDWSQKINNISLQFSQPNYMQQIFDEPIYRKHDEEIKNIQNTTVLEMILKDINENYNKLKVDMNKFCTNIIALQKSKNSGNQSSYQRLISTKKILLDKTNYKLKKIKKLIALIENEREKIPTHFLKIMKDIENLDQDLSMIKTETMDWKKISGIIQSPRRNSTKLFKKY